MLSVNHAWMVKGLIGARRDTSDHQLLIYQCHQYTEWLVAFIDTSEWCGLLVHRYTVTARGCQLNCSNSQESYYMYMAMLIQPKY